MPTKTVLTMKRLSCFLTVIILLTNINMMYGQQKWGAPKVIPLPENSGKYAVQSRKFTGIPSTAVAPNGRVWAVWYTGITPDEDHNNYVVVSTSADGGNTWEEVLAIDPDGAGPFRAYDPEIWLAPDNSLWVFWSQTNGMDFADLWTMKTEEPDKKGAAWSSCRFIANGVMMNKPTVLSTGEWLFSVALWNYPQTPALTNYSSKVYVSTDKGKNIKLLGACNAPADIRTFDEHMIIERKDGSLWMLVRTKYGIGESISTDRGKTWIELRPSKIMNTSSRFFITRLSSGNLLLVKNGPIDIETIDRSHLMAFISTDDGATWSKGLLIEQGPNVSYPDGQQTKDGRIHVIYDFNRRSDQLILKTDFTEADILDSNYDAAIVRVHNNRKEVSKGGQ